MRIYERTNYGIADIVNQINSSFGFSYVKQTESSGYIILNDKIKLFLKFSEQDLLTSAKLVFPTNSIDMTASKDRANTYMSSIDSSMQIISLIETMTKDTRLEYGSDDSFDKEVDEKEEKDSRVQ